MMKEYFFITQHYKFTTNLDKLFIPCHSCRKILITEDVHNYLTSKQKNFFDKILVTADFSLKNLKHLIQQNAIQPKQVKLISHDDVHYKTIARLNESLSLHGFSFKAILPFIDKVTMKNRLKNYQINIPKYMKFTWRKCKTDLALYVNHIEKKLHYPLIAKPIDGAGAFGITILNNRTELLSWCKKHHTAKNYEIEEFIEMRAMFHCDSIIKNGKVLFTQVCQYASPCADFAHGKVLGSYTLEQKNPLFIQLTCFAEKVIAAYNRYIQVPDGVVHLEVMQSQSGQLFFLEIQFRPPGANVVSIYNIHLGFNLEEYHFRLQIGLSIDIPNQRGPYAGWLYFPTGTGVIKSLIDPPVQSEETVFSQFYIKPKQTVTLPPDILNACDRGFVVLSLVIKNNSLRNLVSVFKRLVDFKPYLIE